MLAKIVAVVVIASKYAEAFDSVHFQNRPSRVRATIRREIADEDKLSNKLNDELVDGSLRRACLRKLGTSAIFSSTAISFATAAHAAADEVAPFQIAGKFEHVMEIFLTLSALFNIARFVWDQNQNTMYEDDLTQKTKIVMDEEPPYGLDKGRRYFNDVIITDVLQYCEAGKVNSACTDTIAGFLSDVNSNNGHPSSDQQETANAVFEYLDSLSNPLAPTQDGETQTSVAFSSYLDELSAGKFPAPSEAQSVANYLQSLNEHSERLATIEKRMNHLETGVSKLPDELSDRIISWQQNQNDKLLAKEKSKISSHLVDNVNGQQQSKLPL